MCWHCGFGGPHAQEYATPQAQPAPYYGNQVQATPAKTSGLAVASMILGIIGMISFLFYGWILSLLAIIFGGASLSKIKNTPGLGGKGMAIAGLTLGIIFFAIGLLFVLFAVIFVLGSGFSEI